MARTKTENLEQLPKRPWSREFVPEDGLISARVPELPGCFASGTTWEEAHSNLEEALASWLAAALESGIDIPPARGEEEPEEYSGRFSVRVPRSLHRRLATRAETEDCSLNQLVTAFLGEAVQLSPTKTSDTDAHEEITADAVMEGPNSVGALKGIGTFLRNRGDVNLACLVYAFAAERVADGSGGAQEAAKEFGAAGALARREGRMRLAEALLRQSLRRDMTNVRSNSGLGQILHHQGRYGEAIEYLDRAAGVDNYALLFLGWSRLQVGVTGGDDDLRRRGLSDLSDALRKWATYAPATERRSWLGNVRRLNLLGTSFREAVDQLIHFANSNANWPRISRQDVEDPRVDDETNSDGVVSAAAEMEGSRRRVVKAGSR